MIVTVTGCNGFIGLHLSRRMAADGYEVRGIDRNGQADVSAVKWFSCDDVASDTLGMMVPYDSVIVHLAARLGPETVMADPLALLQEHEETTRVVCEIAAERNALLVLASTSEVYGWNTKTPFNEEDPTTIGASSMPRTSYAISKLHSEHVALAYARQRGLRVIIPRFFNVVGPGQRFGFVLTNFAKAALSGEPLIVHGDGESRRSFLHVDDCVESLVRLIDMAKDGNINAPAGATLTSKSSVVVNVGPSRLPVRIVDVATMVGRYVESRYGIKAAIQLKPYEQTGDDAWKWMAVRQADSTRLRELVGKWEQKSLEQIVADVCDDMADRIGVKRAEGKMMEAEGLAQ